MENDVEPPLGHKLCGYLRSVHSIPTNSPPIPPNSACHIAGHPPNAHFLTSNGVLLTKIDPKLGLDDRPTQKKRRSKIGMVDGVVQQLHTLLIHKCLSIVARVIDVSRRGGEGEDEELRAVVLVDVYLPVELWTGWQFPRSGVKAATLFKHLSCDWEARRSMLRSVKLHKDDYCSIWNVTDCHVLGCKYYCSGVPENPKKKLFELQEIFSSLPCATLKTDNGGSSVKPAVLLGDSGLSDLSDDILINILVELSPVDLLRVSLTCHHLRYLAASIMPCTKLKLYPHQKAAVDWMLQREQDPKVLQHPLFMDFKTEDGFDFCINVVSGEIISGLVPTIKDFHGGMFCDEPGLGKTITALSLILKTQGTLAMPPNEVQVIWCIHDGDRKCGYYETDKDTEMRFGTPLTTRTVGQKAKRGKLSLDKVTPKKISKCDTSNTPNTSRSLRSAEHILEHIDSSSSKGIKLTNSACSVDVPRTRGRKVTQKVSQDHTDAPSGHKKNFRANKGGRSCRKSFTRKRDKESTGENLEYNETWVQCDACSKWRRLDDGTIASSSRAWFCRMNNDLLHQSCNVPEESWDRKEPITYLPGFHAKGASGGQEENKSFFVSVLQQHKALVNAETNKALIWLTTLSPVKLAAMETIGLVSPDVGTPPFNNRERRDFHKIFKSFGLINRVEKDNMMWYYPENLVNLVFDLDSLRVAVCEPLDSFRVYLSSATLIVVPSNLVDHWKTQIEKHVRPGKLKVYVWGDQKKKPAVHNLAWDYDVVITTFSRLSAEWDPHKRSVLNQVHWLRLVLDEGHTLGLSLSLTNKLQMLVSLIATNRWLLTGTPTPNTPNSQLSSLQTMLKFLQEEAYGLHQKSWEAGILRPFEAEMEEGRFRLLQLLQRCMISARKKDLQTIPPCVKKVRPVDFEDVHARNYNELVETVRRNILMADWNDPSHVESLLNPKQWKFRSNTIRNVRLSCCVAGHVRVTEAGEDIQETMDILIENGLEPESEEYDTIKKNLLEGGNCMRCREWCRLPVITPCRHLLCLQCVALDSEKCSLPGCGYLYEMQSPETLARPENPNPKWPVPKDLIELQPSYRQDDWNPDWQSTSSSKVTYLVRKLKKLQEKNRLADYSMVNSDETNSYSRGPYDTSLYQSTCKGWSQSSPEKVIIFSQFLEHIHVIEQQLTTAGIQFAGMYSPMHSSNKMKSLVTFQHDPNCMALLMDGSAALGLDLSFVNHVYLMEPIWDRSVEEQVISRAHRMGAMRPIHVKTLAMKGTIEEQMVKFLQDADGYRTLVEGEKDLDGTRSRRTVHDFAESNYLARLSFVRTNSQP